jgi:nitrous oxidase accessory protein NosD
MAHTSRNRRLYFEPLEVRQMLAAHIVGDPTSYATIQAAVNAAMPGAIINVDAGVYSEQVTISKQLTVRGAQAGVDPRGNARLYASSSTETILNGYDTGTGRSPSFLIKANDVTIDGFVIQGNTSTDHTRQAGIVIGPNQHGTHVLYNIVQNNVSGLFLSNDSATDAALIRYNVFRNNNNAGLNGGRGIYSDGEVSGGLLTNVVIDSNFFYNNRGGTGSTLYEAAIALQSRTPNSQSNFTITNNSLDHNGKGILVYNADTLLIKSNVVTATTDQWSGTLRFEGDVHNVNIRYNTVYANTGPAIRIDSKGYPGNSSAFFINNNNFYGNSTAYSNKESLVIGAGVYDGKLDARSNWWGNASGPSYIQPGTGDRITANGASVQYSPWATAPVGSIDLPYFGAPFSDGAVIQAEDFDHGGEGVAYHDSDKSNNGTKYRTTGVDIESTNDGGAGYDVGWVVKGEWLRYNVKLDQAGTYNIDFRVSNQSTGGAFHLEVDGVNVTGSIAVPGTTNWQIFKTITKTGIALSAGNHVLRIVGDTNGSNGRVGNFNWFRLTNSAAVPATPTSLLAAPATTSQINLSWNDNATNETGYQIDRSLDGITFAPLATLGVNVTSYSDTGLSNTQLYWYRVRATNSGGDSANSNVAYAAPTVPSTGPIDITDLPWVSATAGWGTIQLDASIKGNPITLRGTTYAEGIGTHADSTIVYNLGGQYASFVSDIGIDDETAGNGAVTFQVLGDGVVLYDSGVLTGTAPVASINVNVTGVQQLTLQVTGANGTIDYGHADWAGAKLIGI